MSVAKVAFAILFLLFCVFMGAFLMDVPNGEWLGLVIFAHLLFPAVIYFILKKGKEPEATFEDAWYENF